MAKNEKNVDWRDAFGKAGQTAAALTRTSRPPMVVDDPGPTPTVAPSTSSVEVSATTPTHPRHTTVLVPADVLEQVRNTAGARNVSVTEFVLEVFNLSYTEFASWFVPRMSVPGPMPPRPVVRRRKPNAPNVDMFLYLTAEQRDVLDAAAKDANAGSRSALVTRMLEEHFKADAITSRSRRS